MRIQDMHEGWEWQDYVTEFLFFGVVGCNLPEQIF